MNESTFIFLLFSTFVFSWELSSIGIHNFTLLHSKTFVLRVFLCILPSKSLNNTVRIPTLVESTWPENYFSLLPKIFPYKQLHSISENQKGDCSLMHQALQTELDDLYRLWVLDEGNDKCPPKIFIFDLLRDNRKVMLASHTKYIFFIYSILLGRDNKL